MCEGESARRGVFFRSGFVVGARSSRPEDRLGEFLIRIGLISKQQFADASHFIKSGWKMGEILAELKVIEKGEIEKYVRMQILEIACSVLIDPPRKLTFSDLSAVDSVITTPLSVADVIMEAARKTPHIDAVQEQILGDERRLGFSSEPLLRFQDVSLAPEEAFILSRIDGTQSAQQIITMSPLTEEQTARTLLGLQQAGVIEPEGEMGHRGEKPDIGKPAESAVRQALDEDGHRQEIERTFEEFQSKNHWEVLEVARGASINEVKDAFQEKAKHYHPDRFRRVSDPELQEKIGFIFCRVKEAYDTLSTQNKAEDYKKLEEKESQYEEKQKSWTPPTEAASGEGDEKNRVEQLSRSRHPTEAQAFYNRAKRAYDLEDYWTTIQLCQQAIEIVSDKAEYYYLLGQAQSQNPKWRLDAERNFKIATNLDPWKGDYLVALGKLYENAGMTTRAQRMFDQAKAVDPSLSSSEQEKDG
jgi:hypothetical protein